jgi:hypothetical protein
MQQNWSAALRLHQYLVTNHWRDGRLVGPDVGIRFNQRLGRFVKSYLRMWPWHDSYYYLQAQGYWVLSNWLLFELTAKTECREIALHCCEQMQVTQRKDGAWDYPNPEWGGRVATAECTWASLGLLDSYRRTADRRLLEAALRWHEFLIHEVGFEQVGDELSVNYFAKRRTARIPNNSAFVLRFLSELADVTGDNAYVHSCPGLVTFIRQSQQSSGEIPYMVRSNLSKGKCWDHFQCNQYNAFQCLDLMRYFEITGDPALRPILAACLKFLRGGLAENGRAFYDCSNHRKNVTYYSAAMGAAFDMAGRLGFDGYDGLGCRAFSYLLRLQRPDGSFPYSSGDYLFLQDQRSYPRHQSMILFHLLVTLRTAFSRSTAPEQTAISQP